jgi:hypothetical protein
MSTLPFLLLEPHIRGCAMLQYRADGWPLCPRCGDDELWSPFFWDGTGPQPPLHVYIAAGLSCYQCGWTY